MGKKITDKKSRKMIGVKPMEGNEIKRYLNKLKNSWELIKQSDGKKKIAFTFKFRSFRESIDFVNKVADIAESENHHPAIHINYDKVRLSLTTHSIGGLSENDFIVAAKIENLVPPRRWD